MARLENKVALITGAARGQGRAHAVRLAQEGADIVAIDICKPVDSAKYSMASAADLAETAELVEALDRRIVTREVDVRDLEELKAVVDEGVAELGHIDIVSANAGIVSFAPGWELTEAVWDEMIDINLNGVWKTCAAVIPHMIERGQGGSLILTSSTAGLAGVSNLAHYTAAKHGVVGLMRALAVELAQYNIRCNTVHPANVNTDMIHNQGIYDLFFPHLENPTREQADQAYRSMQALPVNTLDPVDISNAVLWLASDEARYVTGITLPVDAGGTAPYRLPNG
ncbi:Putative short-chain type dehydrogenase/reductase (plasmid) [Rhodococcus ruber]|uniref:mycofactocin-coupled SDR family oxidoreductase n=1 Tax=Rhodococcus ruber TaxID=1830 RepID=UPI00315CCE0A